MSPEKENVTVVIPALNEEKAIGRVIDELREEGFENVLVVDGHSEDRTVEIAKDRKAKVIYQRGSGKTEALRTAIDHVNTPFILVMDGDWTYPAGDISKLMGEAEEHAHVIGRRTQRENISRFHRLGNYGITKVFNLLMGTSFEDVLSGMYLLQSDRAKELEFPFQSFECEVTISAQLASESKEVPIGYRPRVGERKLSGVPELAKILFAIFPLSRRHGNPSPLAFLGALIISILGIGAAAIIAAPTYLGR